MIYVDLVLRSRSAYLEGEKYLEWQRRPELKKAHFEAEYQQRERQLRAQAAKGEFPAEDLEQRLALARFERDERVAESSLKYAAIWFQTAVELFSPPESRWVALSRRRLVEARGLWKKELDAQGVPYQDYMLE